MRGKAAILAASMFVIFASLLAFLQISKAEAFSGDGSGTLSSPYRIETCSQLQGIADNLSAYYMLVTDINCSSAVFTAIGSSATPFTGSLDGQGFTISSITVSNDGDYVGLFSQSNGATIKNVALDHFSISSSGYDAGTVVGIAAATTIANVTVTNATVNGFWAGGIIGTSTGASVVTATSFNGTVHGVGYTNGIVGVVYDSATISNVYTSGTVSGDNSYSGGIAGNIGGNSTITNAYSTMTVNQSSGYVGGLIGVMGGSMSVSNSFFAGVINTSSSQRGGIVGLNSGGTMSNNYYDSTTCSSCDQGAAGSGTDTGGTAVSGSANFKTDNSHSPLTSWNFSNIWQANTSAFPTLRQPTAPIAPSTPTNLKVNAPNTTASLSWGAPATTGGGSFLSYQVQFMSSDDSVWTTAVNTGDTSATISGLTVGKTYSFRVRAINTIVNGSYSTLTNAATIVAAAVTSTQTTVLIPPVTGYGNPVSNPLIGLEVIAPIALILCLLGVGLRQRSAKLK